MLPVKHGDQAKSRLATPPHVDRLALAHAVALDSLAAVQACPAVQRVVVVTSDPAVRTSAAGRCEVVADPGGGLLPAVEAGLHLVPPTGQPAAVLLADVPALTPDDLTQALAACGLHDSAFVPDSEGTGTVLLASRDAHRLHPAFGVRSAQLHEAGGAVRLELDLPRLRRDVDTWHALQQALALGVGPATRAAVTPA